MTQLQQLSVVLLQEEAVTLAALGPRQRRTCNVHDNSQHVFEIAVLFAITSHASVLNCHL